MIVVTIDTETNGIGTFDPPSQVPIQLGILVNHLDDKMITTEIMKKSILINHATNISTQAYNVHHISLDHIKQNGITREQFMITVKELIADYTQHRLAKGDKVILIGHNVRFDLGCLNREFGGLGNLFKASANDVICTMRSRSIIDFCKLPSRTGYTNYKFPTLKELAGKLHIKQKVLDSIHLHDAVSDCILTFECFRKARRNNLI